MDQTIVNWVMTGAGTLLGFLLNAVWQSVKDLQTADKLLADKVATIEVLVAGEYVRKDEFERAIQRLFEKLDHIEEKFDRKLDR
jgi:hypothetical protein